MTRPTPTGRVFGLDNLRAALVVLVVLHHSALVYSAFAPFYYVEPPFADPLAFLLLGLFALINQAWFMSTLFFIAGYFTPDSYDRKGPKAYLLGRLLRLGLPLLVGIFLIDPIARIGSFLMPREVIGTTASFSLAAYPEMLGLGPLWFVALALVFSIGYALWRNAAKGQGPIKRRPAPPLWQVVIFVAGLSAVTWMWRMLVPMGQDVTFFTDALTFPTLAYLPHYLRCSCLYCHTPARLAAGLDRKRDLAGCCRRAGRNHRPVALGTEWHVLPAHLLARCRVRRQRYMAIGHLRFVGFGDGRGPARRGARIVRVAYQSRGPVWRFLARQSYAAFLIHVIVVTFVAFGLHGLAWPALAKFVLLAVIAVPLSFGLAWLIRLIPGVNKVV